MNYPVEVNVGNDQSHLDQTEKLPTLEERLAKLTQELEELQLQNIYEMEQVAVALENSFDDLSLQLNMDMTKIKSIHELARDSLRITPSFPEQFTDPMDLSITDLKRNINNFKSLLEAKANDLKIILMIAGNYSRIQDKFKTDEALTIFASKARELAGLSGTIIREMANIDHSVTMTINKIHKMIESFSEAEVVDSSLEQPNLEQSQGNQAKTYLESLKTLLELLTPLASKSQGDLVSVRLDSLVTKMQKISVE